MARLEFRGSLETESPHFQGFLKHLIIRKGRRSLTLRGAECGSVEPLDVEASQRRGVYELQYLVVIVTSKDVPSELLSPLAQALKHADASVRKV